MKMSQRKPRATVSEMDHTNVLRKPNDPLAYQMNPAGYTGGFYHTSTMFYPAGHPLRAYKDAKRDKKASRVAAGS